MRFCYNKPVCETGDRGFTLIEVMISIVILSVLSIIAMSAYQNYAIKAQVSESLNLLSGGKPVVEEYHSDNGSFPSSSDEAGYSGSVGKYVSSSDIENGGAIVGTFGILASTKISGQKLSLTPLVEKSGNTSWECTSTIDKKYLPSSCDPLVITTQTQNVSCTTVEGNNYSYTGLATQTRQTTTNTVTGESTSTDWQTTSNTCAPAASVVTTETQNIDCNTANGTTGLSYTGNASQTRQVTTDYTGAVTTGAWTTTTNTCEIAKTTLTASCVGVSFGPDNVSMCSAISIQNTGSTTTKGLAVIAKASSPNGEISNSCSGELAPGSSCSVSISSFDEWNTSNVSISASNANSISYSIGFFGD